MRWMTSPCQHDRPCRYAPIAAARDREGSYCETSGPKRGKGGDKNSIARGLFGRPALSGPGDVSIWVQATSLPDAKPTVQRSTRVPTADIFQRRSRQCQWLMAAPPPLPIGPVFPV